MSGPLVPGEILSHYRILSKLGAGGMGVVYLAEDLNLKRKVALKTLSPELTSKEESIYRFKREALAASSLSHPNIIVVYEIGCEGEHFIVTEYVQGETVRERLQRGRMEIADVLSVSTQTASALSAAHQANLLHRDIKAENIMIRHDGYVKVLDFGLAKSVVEEGTDGTRTMLSQPGVIIGTISAMSPEQIRGQNLDARSDLFSLGVVMYEMLTGSQPHQGESAFDIGASILREVPQPVSSLRPEAPPWLSAAVAKLLHKRPEERFQSASELLQDLERLKASSSFTPRISFAKRFPAKWVALAGLGVLAGLAWQFFPRAAKAPPAHLASIRMTVPVTDDGRAQLAALSPDAKYVAVVEGDGFSQSVSIRQIAQGTGREIVPSSHAQYWGLAFSSDGNTLYLVRADEKEPYHGLLYQVPREGGSLRKLVDGVISPVAVSPDGQRLAYLREDQGPARSVLAVTDANGAHEQVLASGVAIGGPAWSPDGVTIAFARPAPGPSGAAQLAVANLRDGSLKRLGKTDFFNIRQLAWRGDGSLLVAGQEYPTIFAPQIFGVSYPSGEARLLTDQMFLYPSLSAARASGDVAAVQVRPVSNMWIALIGTSEPAVEVPVKLGYQPGRNGLSWGLDNTIVYGANLNGVGLLMATSPDGSGERQLTLNSVGDVNPFASPSGDFVLFASNRSGERHIWRIDRDGRNLKELTAGAMDWQPSVAAGGQWLAYSATYQGKRGIWKVRLDGSGARPLNDLAANHPIISPDGKRVACLHYGYYGAAVGSATEVAILDFDSGSIIQRLPLPATAEVLLADLRWTRDGSGIAYIDTRNGVSNIVELPLAGGSPRQLTRFDSLHIYTFDFSPDGQSIVVARGGDSGDVVLMKGLY